MFVFAISGFINGIIALIFGLFVYAKNRKARINKIFTVMSLAIALWGISYGMWQVSDNKETAIFWVRILSYSATFIPVLFLHWTIALLELTGKKFILAFCYFLTFIFAFFSSTSLYIKDLGPILNFPWWPQAGFIYTLYILVGYGGFNIYGFYLLLKSYEKVSKPKQEQIKYVILGSLLGLTGGVTNFPLWYGIPYYPYGTFLVFLYPFILGYAILRHKLMDIKVAVTELLVFTVAAVLAADIVLAKNLSERLFRGAIFLTFCLFGYYLIKSVLNEIKRREESERLTKAKSEFLSIASHQLRTPLTAIKGYISMMLEGTYGKLSEILVKPLKNVYESNEKLTALVNDLLNLSRLEAGKIEFNPVPSSLEKIVLSVIDDLKINADKRGLYLRLEESKEVIPDISVDEPKIRQVVLNIIDNAIKYTEKGGITVKVLAGKSCQQIVISDTGVGISEQDMKNLFQMFSRADSGAKLHTEGAGIGLHVAKKFTEMHQGRIWMESPGEGKGSTFYIELPINRVK